jgi:hypothetical protein
MRIVVLIIILACTSLVLCEVTNELWYPLRSELAFSQASRTTKDIDETAQAAAKALAERILSKASVAEGKGGRECVGAGTVVHSQAK